MEEKEEDIPKVPKVPDIPKVPKVPNQLENLDVLILLAGEAQRKEVWVLDSVQLFKRQLSHLDFLLGKRGAKKINPITQNLDILKVIKDVKYNY